MLVVRGGPITAVARGSSGEPVVLLSDEFRAGLSEEGERVLLDLGTAVLDAQELRLLGGCLAAIRRGDPPDARHVRAPSGGAAVVLCVGPSAAGART